MCAQLTTTTNPGSTTSPMRGPNGRTTSRRVGNSAACLERGRWCQPGLAFHLESVA